MKSKKTIRILLIEDNPGDARLIAEMLAEAGDDLFDMAHADCLATGLAHLEEERFDLLLLDLSLSDSQGMDTFVRVNARSNDMPVVVLTGSKDEILATQAMRAGAQDYLVKGDLESNLLVRSIRYAIERNRLMTALDQERQIKREQDEIQSLNRISGPDQTSVTARLFGMGPLREILPEVFNDIVVRYSELMDRSLEERNYKVEHHVTETLRSMADELGFLKAQPRDVVEIHTVSLKKKYSHATSSKSRAYAEEGGLMLIQIMGYLTTYYRTYAIGK